MQSPRVQEFGKAGKTNRAGKTGLSGLSMGDRYMNTHTNCLMLLSKMADLFSLLSSTRFSAMML